MSNTFRRTHWLCSCNLTNYNTLTKFKLLVVTDTRGCSSTSFLHRGLQISWIIRSYLCKQLLLLSEELFLRDAQVLQSGAGLPPLESYGFTLLQDVFHLRDVRRETKTLEGCGVKTRGESEIITLCSLKLLERWTHPLRGPQYMQIMEQDSPLITCSGEMVFLSDLLHISLASEDMRCINSVQQLTTSSLASFATRTLGSVSLIILLIAALGMVRSSSFPEEEAIAAGDHKTKQINQRFSTERWKELVDDGRSSWVTTLLKTESSSTESFPHLETLAGG